MYLAVLLCLGAGAPARAAAPSPPETAATTDDPMPTLVRVLQTARTRLSGEPDPLSYLGYTLTERHTRTLEARGGALEPEADHTERHLDIDVRVGDMRLDSTHKLRGGWGGVSRAEGTSPRAVAGSPLADVALIGTDETYRQARKYLRSVRANEQVRVAPEDDSDDFSAAPVTQKSSPAPRIALDANPWKTRIEAASTRLAAAPTVERSFVRLEVVETRRWLADSEGRSIADGRARARLSVWANTTAPDGMRLQVYDYVDVASEANLPDERAFTAMLDGVASRVAALRSAPTVEPYEGPAILRGRASGVFFHEIFGHRIEGHRQKDEEEGQTFTRRVGQPVLPSFLSVVDDPTLTRLAGHDLAGTYAFDDEGVAAERVVLVENGILRGFLQGRSPIRGFARSNGHGRREPGNDIVPRQGNLIVEAQKAVPYAKLREMLINEVKRQGKPFGLVFDDISGGFTFTGRSTPNAFVVQPVTVWKVYPDGRPDELVRGADLIGTPLTTFSRIAAAADDRDVFNGVCGAESGWVPVSASSPSLLVSTVEVQRTEKGSDRPPLLPAPAENAR